MQKIANFIVEHKHVVLFIFAIAMVISAILALFVEVNYNLMDYLPEEAPSTVAIGKMNAVFDEAIPNARVLVRDVSLPQALAIKQQLLQAPHVTQVTWLDDLQDVKMPLNFLNQDFVEAYYKDGDALFSVHAELVDTVNTLKALQAIAGENGAVSGQVVSLSNVQTATSNEIYSIMAIMVPVGILLLVLTTRNWLEPIVLLIVIMIGILLNMGTNVFFGKISFLTQSVAAVLQLAVSLDYAIFLLHRFNDNREAGMAPKEAMKLAVTKASVAITSSALTTFLGFLVLIFMRFRIGGDMGVVLAKGILFSLVSVVGLMPVVVLYLYRWLDKTTHKSFLPTFQGLAKLLVKHHTLLLIMLVVTVVSFLAQQQNDFLFSMNEFPEGSKEQNDLLAINREFGAENQMVLLVPRGDLNKELALTKELKNIQGIKSIISYSELVGATIPQSIPSEEQLSQLVSENYSRIILVNNLPPEGEVSFGAVEEIKARTAKYYDESYLAGELPSTYDMMVFTTHDNTIVNGLAILTIGLVLVFTFKSLAIALILLLTIETSIWINLAIPYFSNTTLSYIGYLIVSSVQLGATVDYGILYTQHYIDNRRLYNKYEASRRTIVETIQPLLPPALILTLAGFALWQVSTLGVVSELGLVLGRGAALSFMNVIFFLPALYMLLDGFVEKTTKGAKFLKAQKKENTDDEKVPGPAA